MLNGIKISRTNRIEYLKLYTVVLFEVAVLKLINLNDLVPILVNSYIVL